MTAWHARPAELFELEDSTCRALLGIHHVGRLILPGDEPDVVPLNYVFADDDVLIRTVRRAPMEQALGGRVVFEVDMVDERTRSGWSVVVRGLAREAADEADDETTDDPGPAPWAPGERPLLIRIRAEQLSGRLLRGAVVADPTTDGGYA